MLLFPQLLPCSPLVIIEPAPFMSDFVHLHLHTDYSLLDGACRLSDLVGAAKEFDMPAIALTDLQKGDAVMIVSTQGDSSGVENAITLLAGVEALLTASPSASQAMMMSPWSLGSASVEAAANP